MDLDLFLGEALRDLLFDLLLDLLFERLLERDLLLDLALESRLRLLDRDRDFDLDLDLDRDLDLDLDLDRDFRLLRSSVSRIRLSKKKVAFINYRNRLEFTYIGVSVLELQPVIEVCVIKIVHIRQLFTYD